MADSPVLSDRLAALEGLRLGRSRADVALRVERARLRALRVGCPYCGMGAWQWCVTRGLGRRLPRGTSHLNRVTLAWAETQRVAHVSNTGPNLV